MTDLLIPEVSPVKGCLQKMAAALPSRQDEQVVYHLRAGEHRVALNERIGSPMRLAWSGAIACTHCGRATKKALHKATATLALSAWRSAIPAS